MPLFRRTPSAPPPPTDEQILTTLAAVMLAADEHDGAISLTEHEADVLAFAQAEAHRRGLFR